jgi:putative CocE/NonD family hydrolase
MSSHVLVERNVPVPMRDGTVLRADVYRPDTPSPLPAVVSRVPYDRTHPLVPLSALDPERAVEAGFAVVCQDTRGRYESEGRFYPFVHEGKDGFDTIEWVAAQPWCSGAVGMAGRSYAGATQWLAAVEQPPHLKAIFPVVIGSEFYEGWIYQGGAFQLGFNLFWALLILAPNAASRPTAQYRHLPLSTLPLLREKEAASFYFDWIAHATNDDYWQALAINRRYNRVQVPAFNVAGWYDVFLRGTLENFARMRQEGGSAVARTGQRLLVGPWAHGSTYGPYPDHGFELFAPGDATDLTDRQLRFFAHHLKSEANGLDQEAPVRIFIMGENQWRDEQEWPLARTRYTRWFLHSDGAAGTSGGSLSPIPPAEEPPDRYLYDPQHPAPTVGGPTSLPALFLGTNSGPRDQRQVEERADVLVYTSAALEQPVEVTGPLTVTLYAATTAPDTDFVAKLMDVCPNGVSRILAEGIRRARFRDGYDHPQPLASGRVYEYTIDLVATSNLFLAGHRIRLALTSSSFPRFDRNPNTGNPLGVDGPEELRPARQAVFHDRERPSHILLPVIPR